MGRTVVFEALQVGGECVDRYRRIDSQRVCARVAGAEFYRRDFQWDVSGLRVARLSVTCVVRPRHTLFVDEYFNVVRACREVFAEGRFAVDVPGVYWVPEVLRRFAQAVSVVLR